MRKALTILVLVLLTTMFSLTAKSVTVRLVSYVPETVTFEQTEDTFSVKSNYNTVEYGFYNNSGNLVSPADADVLNISAL